jgi:hypothetical protein
MKNPAPYMQKKLFDLLSGNVSYEAATVPVFSNDEMHDEPLQVVIAEYSDTDASNKHTFQGSGSQVIEVVALEKTAMRRKVDEVGELVMNLIKPTTQSSLLNSPDFQVFIEGRPSINHIIEPSGDGDKIVRLILRYNFLIIEN